jgi:hypothetical protein
MLHVPLLNHSQTVHKHGLSRLLVLIGMIALLAAALLVLEASRVAQTAPRASADVFMQSVVRRDGELGWHQLCPALQAQVPLAQLRSQAQAQRVAEVRQGLTLTVDYMGAHSQPHGGEVRFYVVTAHERNGGVEQRTYIVYTQASGCVVDVKNL